VAAYYARLVPNLMLNLLSINVVPLAVDRTRVSSHRLPAEATR
jgi:hypothetical protein